MDDESKDAVQTDPQPEKMQDNEPQSRTYSQDDVDRKLRGQGTQLKKAQAKIKAFEDARQADEKRKLEEQGRWQEIAKGHEVELGDLKSKVEQYEKAEVERVEKVTAKVKARFNKLPKDLQELVPKMIDPDEALDHIAKLEKLIQSPKVQIHGSSGGREGPLTEEDKEKQFENGMKDLFFGSRK